MLTLCGDTGTTAGTGVPDLQARPGHGGEQHGEQADGQQTEAYRRDKEAGATHEGLLGLGLDMAPVTEAEAQRTLAELHLSNPTLGFDKMEITHWREVAA